MFRFGLPSASIIRLAHLCSSEFPRVPSRVFLWFRPPEVAQALST